MNKDGKHLIGSNGGSSAGSEHFIGELMKLFKILRLVSTEFTNKLKLINLKMGIKHARNLEYGLLAILLVAHEVFTIGYINALELHDVFEQQLSAIRRAGYIIVGISTSRNRKNIMKATVVARALGIKVIRITCADDRSLAKVADVEIKKYRKWKHI